MGNINDDDYEETTETKAVGRGGEVAIPTMLTLFIKPFEGSREWSIKCRLRVRIEDRELSIRLMIINPEDVVKDDAAEIRGRINHDLPAVQIINGIYHGAPKN